MLKIGDFSALSQIPVKTLRYYDERGLLSPAHVDAATGYRYYSATQISRLHRILALRDLGFSLEQIGFLLQKQVTVDQLTGMLLLREAEQQSRVEEETERLERLRSRIQLIKEEGLMQPDVILKELSPQWVISIRERIPTYPSISGLYPRLYATVGADMSALAYSFARWHDPEYCKTDVDAEGGFYLKEQIANRDGVSVYELPACTAASTIHNGSYKRLPEAYDALLRWVAANNYQVAGPIRELYLSNSQPVRQDDESYVTEVQVPVRKA